MPDLFYGDTVSLNSAGDFDFQAWMRGEYNEKKISHFPPDIDPIVEACLVELRTKYNAKVWNPQSLRRVHASGRGKKPGHRCTTATSLKTGRSARLTRLKCPSENRCRRLLLRR